MLGPVTPPQSCTVHTPDPLATALVSALGDRPDSLWLEPCVGDGVFLRALRDLGVQSERIVAMDIERSPRIEDSFARTMRGIDFLDWASTCELRFDRIVANPPYVALSRLNPILRQSALKVMSLDGRSIPLGANYWYAFLSAGLALLSRGGHVGFILPAAWDYADYASPLRDSMTRSFSRFEVHRSRKPLFASVQDGCIVLVGRGFGLPTEEAVRYEHDGLDGLVSALTSNSCRYSLSEPPRTAQRRQLRLRERDTARLGDILEIRLGGVTGDAQYFLLTEEKRIEHDLPLKSVCPVVSRSRHLISGELTVGGWKFLCANGERIWLFNPPEDTVDHPAVADYLHLDSSSGGCRRDRYKVRSRTPWYRTPLPKDVDGFVSGMTRVLPWICLRAMPHLNASNTLYTIRFREPRSREERNAWALSLLTRYSRAALEATGRIYADGLVKYEPGDLVDIPLLVPDHVREREYDILGPLRHCWTGMWRRVWI